MKYCSKCGAQLPDDAIFCSTCGHATEPQPNQQTQNPDQTPLWAQQPNQTPLWAQPPMRTANSGLVTAAKVLMILGTIIMALYTFGIALAWCLPMTISYFRRTQDGRPISTGFKVCTLLFVSMIAGILMLCDNSNNTYNGNNNYYY